MRFQRTLGGAVCLCQHIVEPLRQCRHGDGQGGQLPGIEVRRPCAQEAVFPAQLLQFLFCPGTWQSVKRENFSSGTQQNGMSRPRQFLSQSPQEGSFSAAADSGGDAGTNIQQLRQFHNDPSVLLFIE